MSQSSPEGIILGKGSKLISAELKINQEKVLIIKEAVMELEDYQKRDAHIVKYLKYMISKCEKNMLDYPNAFEDNIKRKAYKDILFKMTKHEN